MSKQRRLTWLLLILLAATFLRLHKLPEIPPGMTHDEADHGLDAWGVVQGQRPLYFSVGYGREPFFDYSTALLMSALGRTYLAGRLTAVFFSLLLIAGSFAWTERAFGHRVALFAAAGLGTGFWPLMTARQALRSETLPALFVLALLFFWRGMERKTNSDSRKSLISGSPISNFLIAGLFLGLTFYTYIPSRIMWAVFPALLLYLLILGRPGPWRGTIVMLLLAGLVALPLFLFLARHPEVEVRIAQLAGPLRAAAEGHFNPLVENAIGALGLFLFRGDSQWRYNLAGRPWLPHLLGILFYVGLAWAIIRVVRCARRRSSGDCQRAPGSFLALVWLFLGLSPALITGPELSSTQAIALQPVLFLFPAIPLLAVVQWIEPRLSPGGRGLLPLLAVLLFVALGIHTWHDYFVKWARAPEVAVQYEKNLVEAIRYLNVHGEGTVAVSTDAPNRFHDPATARLYLRNNDVSLRWFDGRHALLLPENGQTALLFTPSAPLQAGLSPYLQSLAHSQESVGPGLQRYTLNHRQALFEALYPQFDPKINNLSTELSTNVRFGSSLRFLGYDLQTPSVKAGEALRLATLWQVQARPEEDLVLFTHILDETGQPLAQADRLDAPVHSWKQGDLIVQLHEITLPDSVTYGTYPLSVGAYESGAWRNRLPITIDGSASGDVLLLPSPVEVGS